MGDISILPEGRNCTVCKEWKTIDNFYISKRDGVLGRCKECNRAYGRKWNQERRPLIRDRINEKQRAHTSEEWKEKAPANVQNIPLVTEDGRLCSKCGERFPLTEFTRNAGSADGLSRRCNTCAKKQHAEWRERNREHVRAKARETREKLYWEDPEKGAATSRAYRYGIIPDDIVKMRDDQDNKCLICNIEFEDNFKSNRKPCIDHCHTTDKIRGMLCNSCNTAIGMMKDDPKIADAAAEYLRKHGNA